MDVGRQCEEPTAAHRLSEGVARSSLVYAGASASSRESIAKPHQAGATDAGIDEVALPRAEDPSAPRARGSSPRLARPAPVQRVPTDLMTFASVKETITNS